MGEFVHESVHVDGRIGHLESNILHFTCDSLSEHLRTLDRYTTLAAQEIAARKMKVAALANHTRPLVDVLQGVRDSARLSRRPGRRHHRVHGRVLHVSEVFQSENHELMRILHLDTGREMRGGQWQVLRLIDGLAAAGVESTLLAREGAPLFVEARKHGWRVEPVSLTRAVLMARRHDLMHAHDARSHTLGAVVRSGSAGGCRGAWAFTGRVAVEVRAGGAISRGVGIREASADGRRKSRRSASRWCTTASRSFSPRVGRRC